MGRGFCGPVDRPGSPHLLSVTFSWPLSQALWKDPQVHPRFTSVLAQTGSRLLVIGHPLQPGG